MAEKSKNNMEILYEIRQRRNDELKKINDNGVFVIKVEDLGKGKNTGKIIYRLIEEKEIFENEEKKKINQELFYHYENGPVLIGVRNSQTQGEIVPIGFDGDKMEKWNVEKEDIEKCVEERERQVRAVAKMLGIDENEINSLSEIDLSQKIDEKQEEKGEEQEKTHEDEPKQISKEKMQKSGISIMNEVNLNTSVDTKGTTLANALKLEGYTKIMVVHSYKLAELTGEDGQKGKVNRFRFGIVAQKNDGSFETIPESKLKVYRGANNEFTKIDNSEMIETKNEECVFEVPGTNKKLVIDQKDPYGIPDVYLSQTTRDNEGNMAQKLQDKYNGTEKQDVEVRALFNQNKGEFQMDKMHDELEGHTEVDCRDIKSEDVDGNPNTSSHLHSIKEGDHLLYEGNSMTVEEIASEPRFKLTPKSFIEKYNEIAEKQGKDFNLEKIYNEIEEHANEQIHTRQSH